MTMRRWEPFADFRRADAVFNRFLGGAPSAAAAHAAEWRGFPMDVVQEGDELIVRASLPGVPPDEIEVTIEDGLLTIAGESADETEKGEGGEYLLRERRSGRFRRALRLPNSVDADNAAPTCENGVLTIALPKREERKARRLEIKSV